jgi:hypothetical protein
MKLVKKLLRSFSQDWETSSKRLKKVASEAGEDEIPYRTIGVPIGTALLDLNEEDYEKLRVAALQQLPNLLKKAFHLDKKALQSTCGKLAYPDTPNYISQAELSIFGMPLAQLPHELVNQESQLPFIIVKLMRAFVYSGGFEREGPFRTEGDKQQLTELIDSIAKGYESANKQVESFPVPVLAAGIKRYLRQIPGCLIPAQHSQLLSQSSELEDAPTRQLIQQMLLFSLPFRNAKILSSILLLLQACAARESAHKMSATALAVCFGPTVFDTGVDLKLIARSNDLLAQFIADRSTFFSVPSSIVESEEI